LHFKSKKNRLLAVFLLAFLYSLASNKREETHKSSAFDGIGEATLALCRDIGTLFGQNTSVGIQELLQKLYILVVDMFDIILGKVTLFCHR
jgi:hypothetical protein